jgi:hypothetical protein
VEPIYYPQILARDRCRFEVEGTSSSAFKGKTGMVSSLNFSVLCGVSAITILFWMRGASKDSFVQSRSLEQWNKCTLGVLETYKEKVDKKDTYICPILFPLDLLFMSVFGAFLAFGSFGAIMSIEEIKRWAYVALIAPAVYVTADFIEDVALYAILKWANLRTEPLLCLANVITKVKIIMASVGSVQTLGLSGIALFVEWFG